MEDSWRWYGPDDPVPLSYVRQAGAVGVVSALHHIPPGQVWTVEQIRKRQAQISAAGLCWSVVESLPVHEEIKRGGEARDEYIRNYAQTVRNLGECGLHRLAYNFMPVLDWTRTDLRARWHDGSEALAFDADDFAAFELFILCRSGADQEYSATAQQRAFARFEAMSAGQRDALSHSILAGLPGGTTRSYTREEFQSVLDTYRGIDAQRLYENLVHFLRCIVPVAEEAGVYLAIHPDDPPCPILGLPRVVSTDSDIQKILDAVPSAHNGLTFCVGSLGSSGINQVEEMARKYAHRVYFVHLRNVKRIIPSAGSEESIVASDQINEIATMASSRVSFVESDHLEGDLDMYSIIKIFIQEALIRQRGGLPPAACHLPWRPDHGHRMMHELGPAPYDGPLCSTQGDHGAFVYRNTNPGYTAIGRLRGMAEIRGLIHAAMSGVQ